MESQRKAIADIIRRLLKNNRIKKVKRLTHRGRSAIGLTVLVKLGETFMYLEDYYLLSDILLAGVLVHEGTHALQYESESGRKLSDDESEVRAYEAEIQFYLWVIRRYGKDSWQGQSATIGLTIARANQAKYRKGKLGSGLTSPTGSTGWGWMVP
jgi:hypothetical protein